MTVEATHANEIVATFNKAVGSDAKVTLKKSNADVANTVKIADDGKSATITLTGKLTAGTYTVTAVAADETVTADVVAKDEVLSSFEIGTTLKEVESASKNASGAVAKISYKALNQYGDLINYQADEKAVTVSIGKVQPGSVKPCKTSGAGTITIEQIPSMYAIAGQSFTFVIVDTANNTGVTLNNTAVYGASATAKTFKSAGLYNTAKSTFKDIAENDKIEDYALLFTCEDQYDDGMDSKDVAKLASNGAIQVTVAGGLTNIKASDNYKDYTGSKNFMEIDDVTYFAVPLEGVSLADGDTYKKANAGTYTVTIVNNTQGIVFNNDFTVTSGTIIASIQVSPADTIYAAQENELDYVVTDSNGKTITDYATLKDISVEGTTTGDKFTWKKNTDGTAKLIYEPATVSYDSTRPYKNSEIRSCTIQANKAVSGKLIVVSKTFTVYYARTPLAVTGLTSSANRISANGANIDLKLEHLVVLDQYSNPYSAAALKNNATIGNQIYVSSSAINTTVTNSASENLTSGTMKFGTKITIAGLSSAKKEQKLNFVVSNPAVTATKTTGNDYTTTFSFGDTNSVSGLKIESINGGCPLYSNGVNHPAWLGEHTDKSKAGNGNEGFVVITGTIAGKKVTVPTSQWQLVGARSNGWLDLNGVKNYELAGQVITEDRDFSVIVDTADGAQTLTGTVKVSNAPYVGTTISAKDVNGDVTVASDASYSYASADALFEVRTQYNSIVTGSELVTYTVNSVTVSGDAVTFGTKSYGDKDTIPADVITASLPGTNSASLKIASGVKSNAASSSALIAKVKVTAQASKDSTKTASKDITITFNCQ